MNQRHTNERRSPATSPRTAGLWHAQGVVAVHAPKLMPALYVAVIAAGLVGVCAWHLSR